MHSCHHAYRYIFLFLQEGQSLLFLVCLVFSLCFFLYFYPGPKGERERERGGERSISTERGKGIRDWVGRSGGIGGAW